MPSVSEIFGPSFIMGAGIGRLMGEFTALAWINRSMEVIPGVYAVVGAAAFAGGVTKAVSIGS